MGHGGVRRPLTQGDLNPPDRLARALTLSGVQVGVGLASTVQEGFRIPAQRLPSGEK